MPKCPGTLPIMSASLLSRHYLSEAWMPKIRIINFNYKLKVRKHIIKVIESETG